MFSPIIQGNQEINFEALELLMNQGTQENRRTTKNRIVTQGHKSARIFEQRIHDLKKQKKAQWHAALFDFFVNIFTQAIQALDLIVPTLGTGLAKAMGFLQGLNPFIRK